MELDRKINHIFEMFAIRRHLEHLNGSKQLQSWSAWSMMFVSNAAQKYQT